MGKIIMRNSNLHISEIIYFDEKKNLLVTSENKVTGYLFYESYFYALYLFSDLLSLLAIFDCFSSGVSGNISSLILTRYAEKERKKERQKERKKEM